jgi:transposase
MAERIMAMLALLNEKQKRLFLANEALLIGYGGISKISRISGVSRVTITNGIKELIESSGIEDDQRCRKQGGGRKNVIQKYPGIKKELEQLLEPYTKGNPMNPLKYSSKSSRNIERELQKAGFKISHTRIADLLKEEGYSLQANRKELAKTKNHPDRNEQFEYINKKVKAYCKKGFPVLSIDAKKKESMGKYRNSGREYHKNGLSGHSCGKVKKDIR